MHTAQKSSGAMENSSRLGFVDNVDNSDIAHGHRWVEVPTLRIAADWRKPVWRTGGTQKAFPPSSASGNG